MCTVGEARSCTLCWRRRNVTWVWCDVCAAWSTVNAHWTLCCWYYVTFPVGFGLAAKAVITRQQHYVRPDKRLITGNVTAVIIRVRLPACCYTNLCYNASEGSRTISAAAMRHVTSCTPAEWPINHLSWSRIETTIKNYTKRVYARRVSSVTRWGTYVYRPTFALTAHVCVAQASNELA